MYNQYHNIMSTFVITWLPSCSIFVCSICMFYKFAMIWTIWIIVLASVSLPNYEWKIIWSSFLSAQISQIYLMTRSLWNEITLWLNVYRIITQNLHTIRSWFINREETTWSVRIIPRTLLDWPLASRCKRENCAIGRRRDVGL